MLIELARRHDHVDRVRGQPERDRRRVGHQRQLGRRPQLQRARQRQPGRRRVDEDRRPVLDQLARPDARSRPSRARPRARARSRRSRSGGRVSGSERAPAAHALEEPLAGEQLEVAVHGDRRDGVLGRELRERRAAVALDTLEDPRPPEHRRERGVDHARAIADSVSASNRWTRSRSTAARTSLADLERRRRRRLDDDPLIADLDVDQRAVAQRLDGVDLAGQRRRLVAHVQRQVLGAHAEAAPGDRPGPRSRDSAATTLALESPVGRAREQVHARRADERGHPAVRRAVVDLRRRADLLDRSRAQHGDLVGHRHRLDLVVGDVQERPARASGGCG